MTTQSQSQALQDFDAEGGVTALAGTLMHLSQTVAIYDPAALIEPGCDEPTIDCRLRYHDGRWFFYTGDSSYDQDHRGHWGASCVGADLTEEDARELAANLLNQVLESLAMVQDEEVTP
jgi:hypothetical protein